MTKTTDRSVAEQLELSDKSHYTLSLLEYGIKNKLFTSERLREIQGFFRAEFCELAAQYTRRESSSVNRSTAKSLYMSLLYQSDTGLRCLGSDSMAMRALLNTGMARILEAGKSAVLECFNDCRTVYSRALKSRLRIPVPEYVHAMDSAFPEFAQSYSARFAAEDICTTLEYPLLYDISSTGVFFVKDYYTALMYENEFCSLFAIGDIIRVLLSYGRTYGCVYIELYFNICGVILRNYLAGRLINKPLSDIVLSDGDVEDICMRCRYQTPQEISELLIRHIKLDGRMTSCDGVQRYLARYIPPFSTVLHRHIQDGTLHRCLTVC